MIARRSLLLSACLGCALAPAVARAQAAAIAPIRAFADGLIAAMKAGHAVPFAQRAAALRPLVLAAFDLETILKVSVGVKWSGFPAATQADLLAAFTDFTVASWVANFDSFDGETIEVAAETRPVGADKVVSTRIIPRQGDATRLDYVMREASGWRAVDILVDGAISRVAVQRSDFRTLLAKGDAALLASLRGKAAELAGGTK